MYRWAERLDPYRPTGNKQRAVSTDADQLLLTIAIYINPTSSANHIAAFTYHTGGGVYQRKQIYRRLKELGIMMKKASIESFRAFTPENIMHAQTFWMEGAPAGVTNVPRGS